MQKRPGGEYKKQVGQSSLTFSQLFPLASRSRESLKTALLLPVGVTILASIFLILEQDNRESFQRIFALWLSFLMLYLVYNLCGKPRSWLWLAAGAFLSWGGLHVGLALYSVVVNRVLMLVGPSSVTNVWERFWFFMIAAGLPEELYKAVPIGLAIGIGHRLKGPWRQTIGVWDPLDGILLGAASGVGFTLYETLVKYDRDLFLPASVLLGDMGASYVALQQMIERVLGDISGHMAYAGYFGYFLGLAVLKPRYAPVLVAVGWFTSATAHALWNTAAGPLAQAAQSGDSSGGAPALLVGLLSYALLASAILKARQMLGPVDEGVLIPEPAARPVEERPALPHAIALEPAPAETTLPEPKPVDPNLPELKPVEANLPEPKPPEPASVEPVMRLRVGSADVELPVGARVMTERIPGLAAAREDGVVAEVVQNPKDPQLLGLKNQSRAPWTAVLPSGEERLVEPGRSVRLEAGIRIKFGEVEGTVINSASPVQ